MESPRLDWSGQIAVCIATGPSLKREQVEAIKAANVRTIGINDIGLTEYWLDIWYAADKRFWQHYRKNSPALRVCAEYQAVDEGLADQLLDISNQRAAEAFTPWHSLRGGGAAHSGFQALQMALSFRARRVVLVGYDCKARGQLTNYFGRKCRALDATSAYAAWIQGYQQMVIPEWAEVVNATPGSAIQAFPHVELDEALHL